MSKTEQRARRAGLAVLALLFLIAAALLGGFGLIVLVSIPRSDTATSSLLAFALLFIAGAAALAVLARWVAHRARAERQ